MIIFRYLFREVFFTLATIVSVLLIIFISNQFVRYLARVAGGQMPGLIALQLLTIELPNILGLLLPLALFIGILLAYGRMYAENEMTVLSACGFSQQKLLGMTMALAVFVTVIVAIVALWLSPIIAKDRDYLLTGGGASALIDTIVPGRFLGIPGGGEKVFYVGKITRNHQQSETIFLAERQKKNDGPSQGWNIVVAKKGYLQKKSDDENVQFIVLEQGREYQGVPGEKEFRIIKFEKYMARLPQGKPRVRHEENILPPSALWAGRSDPIKASELQWRISIPLMALILAFLAVPLSYVKPRQGKYAKIFPAIFIFMLYANTIVIAKDWVREGKIPISLGLWWVHGLMLLIGLFLWFLPNLKIYFRRKREK